jgi:AcrR family transcriptional regulator
MQISLSEVPSHYREKMDILHSIPDSLHKVSVNDICKNAGISRKKFYSLFESKDSVLYWYLDVCFALTLQKVGHGLTWRETIVNCLELVVDEREFLAQNFPIWTDKQQGVLWTMHAKLQEAFRKMLAEKGVAITPPLDVEVRVHSATVASLIRCWVKPNDFGSAEEFADV